MVQQDVTVGRYRLQFQASWTPDLSLTNGESRKGRGDDKALPWQNTTTQITFRASNDMAEWTAPDSDETGWQQAEASEWWELWDELANWPETHHVWYPKKDVCGSGNRPWPYENSCHWDALPRWWPEIRYKRRSTCRIRYIGTKIDAEWINDCARKDWLFSCWPIQYSFILYVHKDICSQTYVII